MAKNSQKKRSFFASAVHLLKGYLKGWVSFFITTAAMILLASALRGETVLIGMLIYKTYVENFIDDTIISVANSNATIVSEFIKQTAKPTYEQILPDYLQVFPEEWNMKDLPLYWAISLGSSFLVFQGVSGFLQWWYYVRQKDTAEEWKCQPKRWLSRPNEVHEIVVGTVTMTLAGTLTSLIICWIFNGNYNTFYGEFDKYSYAYFLANFLMYYMWLETLAYHFHKLMHAPFFYKYSHKLHHRYKAPTAYSTFAFMPLEITCFEIFAFFPCVSWPIHTIPFIFNLLYLHHYALLQHSGIMWNPIFPWQPHTIFHDDHHKYFHCNMGFNSYFWDWFWDTWRDPGRAYGENIFNDGKGQKK